MCVTLATPESLSRTEYVPACAIYVCKLEVWKTQLAVSNPNEEKKCRPPCGKQCKYDFELNQRGCPKCKCNRSPCERFQAPLDGYFCGRGIINRTDCPSNYACVIAPNDAYAACCPSSKTITTTTTITQPVVTTKKPGSCPTTSS
ncbi:unnamed protein product [Rotaria socialis]|uniref:Uncharacterized protein n=1 Tax=Rotaria socialis TaxID=392032 RepID=A0A817Y323_9BILA|nr:unnamed protein product [Rotaria socialis]CAF4355238.1 unnamed protein product [Rotaria socialis]